MIADVICRTIRSLYSGDEPIALHEPAFAGNEWKYVKECLDTGWVSSVGKYVDEFERRLSDYTQIPYAVAVVNGTAALHACLKLLGVGSGHEVLVPALTFVAAANSISYTGAVPHFVDCDAGSLGIDVDKLRTYLTEATVSRDGHCTNRRTGRPITAIVAVHVLGHSVDLDPLCELCDQFSIDLVEDAAEALGTFYKGRHVGRFGRIAALSFNGNKIITTGGGGALLTGDAELAKAAKHLTTTAKVPHSWEFEHDRVGFNYRLPNINAAVGCGQLEQLSSHLQKKKLLFDRYVEAFHSVEGVSVFQGPAYSQGNHWLNALILDQQLAGERDDVLARTNEQGIMTRPLWAPMQTLPMFADCPHMDLTETVRLYRTTIAIPSSPALADSLIPPAATAAPASRP